MTFYFYSDYGEFPPELLRCKDAIILSGVVGAVMGGVGRSKVTFQEHLRTNQHTAFQTPLTAKVNLNKLVCIIFVQ